ncbi:CU044_5270 family protein [Streptomyces sp. NPDC006285]|uniref:CU044_5270 family protein n=1 Tax=Streptomyces sp. NPDC006285 TaxID=3364742 RepID=UPI0036CEAAF3
MTELPEKDFAPGRHRLLKEHLMSEIRQSEAPARASVRRQWLRTGFATTAVATAAAVTFVLLTPSGEGEKVNTRPPATQQPAGSAATLLEDIALAAERDRLPEGIRDDQFVYVESEVSYTMYEAGKGARRDPVHRREIWLSVDGLHTGLLREDSRVGEVTLEPDLPFTESSKNYRALQKLPTDPEKMLRWLHRVSDGGKSHDQNVFVHVAELLIESLMPPAQSAALYRAAARIPGVAVIPDAVDAAGRHGVAVARVDSGERQELIFDKKTKQFLGERLVAVADLSGGQKRGEVTGTSAILQRAVVDKPGQRP